LGRRTLEHYVPLRDGEARLVVVSDAQGRRLYWQSTNLAALEAARAFASELDLEMSEGIISTLYGPDETPTIDDILRRMERANARIYESRLRSLDQTGLITDTTSILLRGPRGDLLIGFRNDTTGQRVVFDPPALGLPNHLALDRAWESSGVAGQLEYTATGQVIEAGPLQTALGQFEDCLKIESRLILLQQGALTAQFATHDWYCAGVGLVESEELDPSGASGASGARGAHLTHSAVLAHNRFPTTAIPPVLPAISPPTVKALSNAGPEGAAEDWSITPFARTWSSAIENTLPATWIPANPPLVVGAAYGSDLLAFDAAETSAKLRWRFHTAGPIYGPPAFDPARNRLYFGSSDKRLYALDTRGFFLWAFETGDNVATRPVVVGDTLVLGSEDRKIYCLATETGALIGSLKTGGAVVSSPAYDLGSGTVVIGSDDGAAYGVDPQTCAQKWLFSTGQAVEAPITIVNGIAYVASRGGQLYALWAATGEQIWAAASDDFNILRTAPAIGPAQVLLVDDFGTLTAFDRQTGKRLWTSVEDDYGGAPLLVGEMAVVPGDEGLVHRVGLDGTRQGQWSIATGDGESIASFPFGPVVGGGALWLADDEAVIHRIGP
ncbi:MAG: PQQ-binding-like beta-propeller repeat protein, partial [Anaerolineales bacterium]